MKRTTTMKRIFAVFCLLVLAVPRVMAGDPPASTAPEPGTGRPERKAEPAPKTRPRPAPTFTPSEKIGADTVIAFPVDI